MSTTEAADLDLTDVRDYRAGVPYGLFDRLRADGAVHRHRPVRFHDHHDEPVEFWSVVRHAEIQQANRDWETFTARESVSIWPSEPNRAGSMLVSMDPPDHTRLRRLITAGFTPRMIGRLEEHIEARTTAILDAAAEAGTCDFVRDVAYPLPMHVIADIVGIPEADRPWVFERTDLMLRALDPNNDHTFEEHRAVQVELFGYAHELTNRKRAEPADDVWTLIAQAEVPGEDGEVHKLEGIELEMFFVILSIAGSETTRNALSQGLMALVDHPDQLEDLRRDPALLPPATEEIIRWASPVLYFGRTATRDAELGGQRIAAGDRIVLWYPSGNRDERAFDEPYRFDVRRSPNHHVSFGGGGPHFCLGANLARKEIAVLTGALLERFDVELTGPAEWVGAGPIHNVGVSIDHLPVRLTSR